MLPKPKFDLNPRPTPVNNTSVPQSGLNWFQYNPNQSLNQQFVSNYPNYGQNYSNNNYQTYSNNFGQSLWHQNNYNSNPNLNVNNVWNQNNIRFNQNNQNYGKPQHYPRNDYQNKKFKDNNHKNFNHNSNANKKSFNCDPCCRWFQTEELYNQHMSEHIVCGLDECTFKAHPKVIENHQRMQHFCFKDKSLVKKFMNLDSEEDIEKWKEERKRNFPTKDNIQKKVDLKEKQRLEAIEEKNRLIQIQEKQKEGNDKCFNEKSKKNKKSKGKERLKPINTFKNNRKLTLFQKLMMNEIQEENEEKINEKVVQ